MFQCTVSHARQTELVVTDLSAVTDVVCCVCLCVCSLQLIVLSVIRDSVMFCAESAVVVFLSLLCFRLVLV